MIGKPQITLNQDEGDNRQNVAPNVLSNPSLVYTPCIFLFTHRRLILTCQAIMTGLPGIILGRKNINVNYNK